ncbi:MAG: tRNA (adenosine(37)-N6)-dimethylallyltransferase MiaA [Alphaproteobacteria bacterium]|nr:tRNA (adenosine(37)-N6)-dimethylallyltransferase MiaA [Alphaproteobacteria bacterium]
MRAFVVAGPTATGKTALALAVAEATGAVIVSADAMQVYRGMDIGTAKATPEEQARVPHLGIDVVDPDEAFDAADFVRLAESAIRAHGRVVVCGGTSLYVRSLRRGLVETPEPDPAVRERLAALDDPYGQLCRVDPALAARLHPNDHVRILRGLEVFEATGRRLSDLHAAHEAEPDRVELSGFWLDRDDLDARIDGRVLAMMDAGYLDEVSGLLARYDRGVKPMRSLGYRHLADHLLDGVPLDEAVRRTQRDTRRFARKQRTWQKHVADGPGIRAARADGDAAALVAEAVRMAHTLFAGL